jgi:NAD(P)-dependent dehydrogenase (short-subunit alcohol dehydrogenase family)
MKNKRIAIIGASAGIGLELARELHGMGAELILGARTLGPLEKVARSLNAHYGVIDTMDESTVKDFFAKCGPVDHLATPGSSIRLGTFRDTPTKDYLYSLQNKLVGQALCAKHAVLNPEGSITLFSGMLSRRPAPWPLLASVNAAIEALAQGLANELQPVRVNVVSPGLTKNTAAFNSMAEDARQAMFNAEAARLPARRVGEPQDSSSAAVFLMQNTFVTGQVLYVDGGATVL